MGGTSPPGRAAFLPAACPCQCRAGPRSPAGPAPAASGPDARAGHHLAGSLLEATPDGLPYPASACAHRSPAMTPAHRDAIEEAIASLDAQGFPWTNKRVY